MKTINQKPNPEWVSSPINEARFDSQFGHHRAVELKRKEENGETVVMLKLEGGATNRILGYQTIRFVASKVSLDSAA